MFSNNGCEKIIRMNFVVAPCISNIKHFNVQLTQTNYKSLDY